MITAPDGLHELAASLHDAPTPFILADAQGQLRWANQVARGWLDDEPARQALAQALAQALSQVGPERALRRWPLQLPEDQEPCRAQLSLSAWWVPGDTHRPAHILGTLDRVEPSPQPPPQLMREALLETLLTTSVLAIVVLDPTGQIIFATPQAEQILGLSPSQVTARRYDAPEWHSTDLDGGPWPDERQPFVRVMSTGQAVRGIQHAIVWPDGTRKALEINGSPILDERGQIAQVVFAIQDISAIKRSQETLELAAQAAKLGVWEHDVRTGKLSWNEQMFQMFHVAPHERDKIEQIAPSRFAPDELERIGQAWRAVIEEDATLDLEYRILTPEGQPMHHRAIARVHRDPSAEPRRIIGVALDITAQKHLEAELLHSQKMSSFGQLAGGLAHDFNNLLTAILSYLDLLEQDTPAQAQEFVQGAREAAKRGARLIEQLMTFARRGHSEPRSLRLEPLLHQLEPLLRRLVQAPMTLSMHLQQDALVMADPGQLEQVIVNLVTNARDASSPRSAIDVTLRQEVHDAPLKISHGEALPAGRYAALTVQDRGHGMPPEVFERLFEPFFTTKPRGKGTGLGLSTCYGIARQSKGALHVQASRDQGVSVTLYLPCALAPQAPPPDEPAPQDDVQTPSPAPIKPATILLVEDDAHVRRALSRLLRSKGYTILEAQDGQDALELLSSPQPPTTDLILTDVLMPRMSGPELSIALRARGIALPMLYVSGYTSDALQRRGFDVEAMTLIPKPFDPGALAQTIEVMLQGRVA